MEAWMMTLHYWLQFFSQMLRASETFECQGTFVNLRNQCHNVYANGKEKKRWLNGSSCKLKNCTKRAYGNLAQIFFSWNCIMAKPPNCECFGWRQVNIP